MRIITRTFGWASLALLLGTGATRNVAQTIDTLIGTGLKEPYGVAVDGQNRYYITDSAANRIALYVPDTGTFTNFAGLPGAASGTNDGRGVFARFYSPQGIVAVDFRQGLVVADSGNHTLRLVSYDGVVTTLTRGGQGFRDGPMASAQFQAPAGLAADTNGNVYIADLQNHAVRRLGTNNQVTTVATNLFRPNAVALSGDGQLFIADTGDQCIKVIQDPSAGFQSAQLYAGSGNRALFGYLDSPDATQALFDSPDSLLWLGGASGLLVGDSGNHLLREVVPGFAPGSYAVTTLQASVGSGLGDPTGLARELGGDILIADRANNALLVLHSAGNVQEPVAAPKIGYIVLTNLNFVGTELFAVTNATFNNDITIGILGEPGTQTFFTLGDSDAAAGVPDPTSSSSVPPPYADHSAALPRSILQPIRPDVTIKAIGTQVNRRPSPVVTARFRFQVGSPEIFGTDPAAFTMETATQGADLWYTTDGSIPEVNGPTSRLFQPGSKLNIVNGTNDVLFSVRGFRDGYLPSGVVSQSFLFSNVQTSSVGFGSDFRANVGATVLLPIDLRLAARQALQSLQLRVEMLPQGAAPALSAPLRLVSLSPFDFIPNQTFSPIATHVAIYTDGSTSGLSIAYLGTNDLSLSGPFAAIAITIPTNAVVGQGYKLRVLQVSGTSDGLQDVPLAPLSDRTLTVANLDYLVGDTAPADWYNAGDFGDDHLVNNDVNNVFFASLGVRLPFPFTDAFDAMDAFPLDSALAVGGDGQIRFLDWEVVLNRSLHLRQDNWRRGRNSAGQRKATPTGLALAATARVAPQSSLVSLWAGPWQRQVKLQAGTLDHAIPGKPVRVPITLIVAPGANLAELDFWPIIALQRDAPDSVVTSAFEVNSALAIHPPSISFIPGISTNDEVYVWQGDNKFDPPLSGSNLLGWLSFQVPPSAQAADAFTVRFRAIDGSPQEQIQYDFESVPGTVWVYTEPKLPAEVISDEWKTNFFGSITAAQAQADSDPDNDGLSNLSEYLLNCDPTIRDWRVTVSVSQASTIINWYSETNRTYFVEGTDQVPAGPLDWKSLSEPLAGQGGWQHFQLTSPDNARHFYRVRTSPLSP